MKLKIYALWFVVALTAFGLSLGLIEIGRYLQTAFSSEAKNEAKKDEAKKEESVGTVTIEEITYPPRVVNLTTVPVVEQPAPVIESKENTENEFYADGDYYIIGKLPKGFRDFEILSIVTRDYENASEENNYEGAPIPPKGFFLIKKEFNFTRINIANRQIAFETEAKKGVSYQFAGEFIEGEAIEVKDKDGYEYTDYVVLKGRLKKMRDGKKIAESEVKFAIMHGC